MHSHGPQLPGSPQAETWTLMQDDEILRRLLSLERRVAALEDAFSSTQPPADPETRVASGGGTFEIADVDARIVESNDVWTKYAWKAVLRNKTASPIALEVGVVWKDEDDFPMDESSDELVTIPEHGEAAAAGFSMLDPDVALRVRGVVAKARLLE